MRFPEFEREWEETKLGDLAEISSGGTPSRSKLTYWDGEIPWVSTTLIDFNTIYQTDEKITDEGLRNSSTKLYPKGTLLIAMYGQGKTRGKTAVLGIDATVNQACASIQVNNKILDNIFLFQNLSMKYFEIRNLSNQGGQENLTGGIIKEIIISYPKLAEQHKIASFLTLIDKRIKTQREIIEDLESLKSAIKVRLFDKTLSPTDSLNWEIVKLKDLLSVPEKVTPKYIDKDKLLSVRLHLNGVVKNDSTDTLSLGATNYYIRKKGQFIFGKQNIFNGAFGIIPNELDNYLSSGDVPTLDINTSKILPLFLLYSFSRKGFYKPLENIAIGSGSKRIHETAILNLSISLPSLEEQASIVNNLYVLTQKINIEQKILESMLKIKKYLLTAMFI